MDQQPEPIARLTIKEFQKLRRMGTYNGACASFLRLKKDLGKEPHHDVTPEEYANHYGVPLEIVLRNIASK